MLRKIISIFMILAVAAGMFTGMIPMTSASTSIDDGLIAFYNWSDINGTTVIDASGNGKNATISGNATIVDGRLPGQKAIRLSGGSNGPYVSMPAGIVNVNELTISAWINVTSISTWARVFDFGTGTNINMFFTVSAGSNPRFAITINGSANEQIINAPSPMPTNKWTHIAVTLSGNTGKLYINGVQVASNNNMTLKPSSMGNTTQNYIGRSQYPDPYFNGLIGDFRIYNRALSDDDINMLFLDILTDEDSVAADLKSIPLGDFNTVDRDLVLATSGKRGSTITWATSDPSVIEVNGTVHRPAPGQPDAQVILTATVTKGDVTQTKTFECTVPADLTVQQKKESLFINEVMSSNEKTIRDGDVDDPDEGANGGAYSDWIEIYNSSDLAINIEGFKISDSSATWTIPRAFVPGKGYLIIWASDKDKVAKDGQLHANFAISKSGENITLKAPDGDIVDEVYVVALLADKTYGRIPDGGTRLDILARPTPAAANSGGVSSLPVFSHEAGFYTEAFQLQISSPDEGAKIYYTTDGSDPVPGAQGTFGYTGSITIKSRAGDPNVFSNISTSESWRPPNGEVFKATVIRAISVNQEGEKSGIATRTFFVDPNMHDRYELPIISIVSDRKNLFDNPTGIYTRQSDEQSGSEWERPMHVEFFESDGTLGFSQNGGVRIHGGATRNLPQKSLRLYAKDNYDVQDYFRYDIFPNLKNQVNGEKITEFKRLILRNSGNDWSSTLFRDAMAQSLIAHLKLDTQAYRPSVVFINGEYWGIHNIRERFDRYYVATHYNLNADDVAMIEVLLRSPVEAFEVNEGTQEDADAYMNEVTGFLKSNPVTNQENYEYIKTKIDVDNFINYQVANIYFANTDWPGNNVKIWRYRTKNGQYDPNAAYGKDGRWRWMVYDTDFGFGLNTNANHDTLSFATATNGPDWPNPPWSTYLLRTLLENTEFRNKFINYFADLLNTVFQPSFVNQRIDDMKAVIASSIPEHIRRWQGGIGNWDSNVQVMKNFANARQANVRQHILNKFASKGVTGTASVKLNTDLTKGHIKINSLDVEPNTPGVVNADSWTGVYFKGVPITLKAVPKLGYVFDHWEGIDVADPTSDTITVPLTSDINITAHFVQGDATPPTLELKGNPGVAVRLGDTYVDAGATAMDDVDGDITSKVIVEGNVDTSKPGVYTLVYKVSDAAGNEAEPVRRIVVVADLSPEPYDLSQGPYSFTEWSDQSPEGTYPQNMIFLQSNMNDPGLEDEMTAPYCNEEALAYRNTRRTRMNGLNEDGVAFINTGR
ncbi:MAG: DUF5011 domain-containing protein, partial [Clostridiaceae bacterium]|nr:DUF5011 domain-containing protein [Clostridiaceae bacterium]